MPTIVVPDGYLLERPNTDRHSRKDFACGKDPLDVFLRTQASQAQGKYVSATHVLIQSGDPAGDSLYPIVGYVTLVTSHIPLADCPPTIRRVSNKPTLPALLLAQMAVDERHKDKKLGEFLLKYALVTAWQQNQNSGCLLVVLDAKDEDAKRFYLKYGFTAFQDKPMRLFLPVKVIEKLPLFSLA